MQYVPQRGDLVWLTFDPQAGHEQAGRRPAVVLPDGSPVSGVVLSDQVRNLDWPVRCAELAG